MTAYAESLDSHPLDYYPEEETGDELTDSLALIDKARAALSPRLTVTGRSAWRAEELGGPPVQRDDDVSPPLYFLPVQYALKSTS